MVDATLDEFGRVDILVNNAGTTVRKAPQEYTLDEWKMVLDVPGGGGLRRGLPRENGCTRILLDHPRT